MAEAFTSGAKPRQSQALGEENLDGRGGSGGGRNREKRSRLLRHVLKRRPSARGGGRGGGSGGVGWGAYGRSGAENISGFPPVACGGVALPCPSNDRMAVGSSSCTVFSVRHGAVRGRGVWTTRGRSSADSLCLVKNLNVPP